MALGAAILIGAAGSAYAANQTNKAASQSNKAASQPSTYQPWGELMPYLQQALPMNQKLFNTALQNYGNVTGQSYPTFAANGLATGVSTAPDLQTFSTAINADPNLDDAAKEWVISMATQGSWDGVQSALPKMGLSPKTQAALGPIAGAAASSQRVAAPATGGGGGRRGGGGGGKAGGGGGGKGGANLIPDTMGADSYFGTQAKSFFDPSALDPANDPTLQPYIDALRRNFMEQLDEQLLGIDEASNARGMYAGSGRALQSALTSQKGNQALADQLAQVYMGQRQGALERQMEALGLINNRDISAGQNATQRAVANINASVQRAAIASQNRQFNSAQARQDALAPLGIFNSYLGGLGQISSMGPSTRTGPYQYTNPGPGALGAGLTSLGGGLMAGYGMGAFGGGGGGGGGVVVPQATPAATNPYGFYGFRG